MRVAPFSNWIYPRYLLSPTIPEQNKTLESFSSPAKNTLSTATPLVVKICHPVGFVKMVGWGHDSGLAYNDY